MDIHLTGYTDIRYDEEKKRIVVEPLELTQAFRNFEGGTAAWEQVGPGTDRKPDQVLTTRNSPTTNCCQANISQFKLPTPKPEEKKEEQKK